MRLARTCGRAEAWTQRIQEATHNGRLRVHLARLADARGEHEAGGPGRIAACIAQAVPCGAHWHPDAVLVQHPATDGYLRVHIFVRHHTVDCSTLSASI